MKTDCRVEVFFDVMLWRDEQELWRASSPAPYIDASDYGYRTWGEVVKAVLDDIREEAGNLLEAGVRIRINFVPAIVTEDHHVVQAFRSLPPKPI